MRADGFRPNKKLAAGCEGGRGAGFGSRAVRRRASLLPTHPPRPGYLILSLTCRHRALHLKGGGPGEEGGRAGGAGADAWPVAADRGRGKGAAAATTAYRLARNQTSAKGVGGG